MNIWNIIRRIRAKIWHIDTPSLITIYIDKESILHNLQEYRQAYTELEFTPVLKSNAYGHGLAPVARILDSQKLPFLIVDSYYEARLLRDNNIKSPILIIGYVEPQIMLKSGLAGISFCITSLEQLQQLARSKKPINLHLKIDTGMHRQGIMTSELDEAIVIFKQNPNLKIQGIASHLADADNSESRSVAEQLKQWHQIQERLAQEFPNITYNHISATAGVIHTKSDSTHNLARLGLGLYGISIIDNPKVNLKPALTMQTIISGVKSIQKGDSVGYNATFIAPRDLLIATIPAGYAEGVDRRLSNLGQVEVNGTLCPIIGRVSMNITTVDVSNIPKVKVGDMVTIISNDNSSPISVANIAKNCDTIPYEILVHIPAHLRRVLR
ncbi:MAG: alanine racemase [Candidatus Paceibacterota bacterium]